MLFLLEVIKRRFWSLSVILASLDFQSCLVQFLEVVCSLSFTKFAHLFLFLLHLLYSVALRLYCTCR